MLEFVFWDVQHGNACYIKTPNDRHIVVDLGIGSYGTNKPFSPLRHLSTNYRISQLDYVIITHPHRDHIDDIENFDLLDPKTLMRPKHLTEQEIRAGNKKEDSAKVIKYLEINQRYNVQVQNGTPSDINTSEQWGGVKITNFHPSECSRDNLNNHSIVTVLEYAGSKIIIPGDNEPASWKELLKRQSFVDAAKNPDVLLAPHHGRKSAYCSEFFEAINKPYITVISDGPECDTSATDLYGKQSRGWRVYYADKTYQDGKLCVTTRANGVIRVSAYYAAGNSPRLNVHVQKGSGDQK